MAAEPVQLPTSGSLAGILDVLETDKDFRALISGEIEVPESDIDPSITVGIPEGLRPALAAGASGTRPVVLVVASGREAEETVEAIRSWYSGDPNDVAQLEAWETLPHERLSPRADTVASRMAVFHRLKHPQEGSKLFGPHPHSRHAGAIPDPASGCRFGRRGAFGVFPRRGIGARRGIESTGGECLYSSRPSDGSW